MDKCYIRRMDEKGNNDGKNKVNEKIDKMNVKQEWHRIAQYDGIEW